ncbi:MAG: restriction endonuclease subunit S [Prevotella sp.]|nr:restriction endonuclease subunit S [Prevotella sp.]
MDFYDFKLGDCLSMIENGATIKQQKGSKGLPITRIETLSNNRFNRDRLGYADIFDANKYSHYILDDNDILMSHINSKAFLGRSVLYKRHGNEQIIHGMNVLRIKTKKDILDQEYAYYYFQTSFFKKNIHNIRKDAVNQSSINISDIKDIIIHIPSLKDQKNIVTVLSNIDCKIALNRQINDNLEAMARQLYDYWFVQFDFPDENGRPYKSSGGKMVWNEMLKRDIPEAWETSTIKDIAKTYSGGTPKSTNSEFYENGNIPWINSGELNEPIITSSPNYITQLGLDNSSAKKYPKGTILIALYGATAGKVSYLSFEACSNQAVCGVMTNNKALSDYVRYYLSSLYEHFVTLSTGSARSNISQETVKDRFFRFSRW